MNQSDVVLMGKKNFLKHGLDRDGWSLKFDRAKRRLGVCRYRTKTISLSRSFVEQASEGSVEDILLHEIAHALVGPGHGHDHVWKAKCLEIGAEPTRLKRGGDFAVKSKYILYCPSCGQKVPRHRKTGRLYVCDMNTCRDKPIMILEEVAAS